MKRHSMLAVVVLCVAGLGLSVTAMGHTRHEHGEGKGARHAEHVIDELGLQGAQAERVRELFQATHESMRAMHKQMREEMHIKMCALHNESRAQLATILNADQLAQLETLREHHLKKLEERDHRGGMHAMLKGDCEAE